MDISHIKLACFSPTGTTRAITDAIARGLNHGATQIVDITKPHARSQPLHVSGNELLVVAVPVYGGRIPPVVASWLRELKGDRTPAVCVAVYGNRAFEDALLELKNTLAERGCLPLAGAAFIGEHSFSSAETPVAVARPDAADLASAEEFGRRIRETIAALPSADRATAVQVPGHSPYKALKPPSAIDFLELSDECKQCGHCAEACPVGAIDNDNPRLVDQAACIKCCACIKVCPEQARSVKPGPIKDIAVRLTTNCQDRKEPEFFL